MMRKSAHKAEKSFNIYYDLKNFTIFADCKKKE